MAVEAEVLEQQDAAPETPPTGARGGGLLLVIKPVAFISVIVIVEIVAAAMLAPTAQETERLGQQLAAASTGKAADVEGEHQEDERKKRKEMREVELGSYNITRFNPSTNTTLAIDFELYGTVLAENAAEFQHYFENNKARIREQVTMTLHGAASADLTDAGLGLIKRQILEKTNRVLGQPLLEEVLFSQFSFVER